MNNHAERLRKLCEALAQVPPDEPNQWGDYPTHNGVAEALGMSVNGSTPGKVGDIRLGMLPKARATLALAARIIEDVATNPRILAMLERYAPGTRALLRQWASDAGTGEDQS
jgi:hypothetical protein